MQNVLNALRVLEVLGERRVAGVSEVARELELPKTTVQRALTTLHAARWIKPADNGARNGWELAAKVLRVARYAGAGDALREAALPVMEELHRATGETIHLLVRDGDNVVLIERIESVHPVRTVQPMGSATPLHASSTGKAVLAHLPEDEREAILAGPLVALTDATVTDPDRLRAQLDEVRARGWAVNAGESWAGLAAVGAPVVDGAGAPVAAVSISSPSERLPEEDWPRMGALVADAGRRIGRALG